MVPSVGHAFPDFLHPTLVSYSDYVVLAQFGESLMELTF